MLVKALLADGQVKELDISYNTISDDGLSCLCNYIKVCACVCVCVCVWWFGDSGFFLFFLVLSLLVCYTCFFVCVSVCVCDKLEVPNMAMR